MKRTTIPAAMLLAALTATASASAQHEGHSGDSAAVASVIAKYHEALAAGDSATALTLLADDAVILESGGVETRAEYRSQHLPGDITFAKAIKNQRGAVLVRVVGDVGWASSTNTTQGEMNGRTINSAGAELMVLVRTAQGWRIAAIHWSSRQRRAGRIEGEPEPVRYSLTKIRSLTTDPGPLPVLLGGAASSWLPVTRRESSH